MTQDVSRPLRPAASVNYYDVLEVSPSASQEVIQAAYRALARACHPDVNPSAAAAKRMLELNAAYTVLSDSKRRAQYDLRRTRVSRSVASPFPSPPDPTRVRGKPKPSSPVRIEDERATHSSDSARGARTGMHPRLVTIFLVIVVLSTAIVAVFWLTSALLDDVPDAAVVSDFLLSTAQPFLNLG